MGKRVNLRGAEFDCTGEPSKRPVGMTKLALMAIGLFLVLPQIPAYADDKCHDPLFVCESERAGKFISICSVEEEAGHRWSSIQYVFGQEKEPEMVYPSDSEKGAISLFFSHEIRGNDYRVTVRFSTGGYTYRVFSY